MFAARHNFGVVDAVKAESLGVPGKRIFRILIDGIPPAAATLWLEKEQLYSISMALRKMLEVEPGEERGSGEEEEDSPEIPYLNDSGFLEGGSKEVLEFKVSRLGVAFGPGPEHITLFFYDERDEPEGEVEDAEEESFGEGEPGSPPKLQLSLTRTRSEEFIKSSLEVCASGRGTDALSRHALVATGKVDPNRNGHFRH